MAVLTLKEATPRLREAYQHGRLIPFLGSGFSRPLDLPMWPQLMGWMGEDLGFDPAIFQLQGLSTQLAGYYQARRKTGLLGFINRMRAEFHAPAANKLRKTSVQHLALAQLKRLRRIYTTNFEHHIEEALRDAHRKVEVLARLEDFSRPAQPDVCQIVKFHGDLAFPETIMLTEDQFFERHRLEAAPDQCLRADLLGNAFLFLGYSFSDTNIRYIWHRMDRLRRDEEKNGKRKVPVRRSYWTTFGAGRVQPTLLDQWHIDVIELDITDPRASVARLLHAIGAK